MDREIRLNVFAGYTEAAARKIAANDLAFFRAELAREVHLSVNDSRDQLRKVLLRLIEHETE